MGKYDDILYMERPKDPKYPPMPLHNRAAQFAPFDALTGFSGRIHEAARIVEQRRELADDEKQLINDQLLYLRAHTDEQPQVTVTYFVPDPRKKGGAYQTATASVIKVSMQNSCLLLEDDVSIPFSDILELSLLQTDLFD